VDFLLLTIKINNNIFKLYTTYFALLFNIFRTHSIIYQEKKMKSLTSFIVFLLTLSISVYSQDKKSRQLSPEKEEATTIQGTDIIMPEITVRNGLDDPPGTVPGLTGYWDYVTNGNNLRRIWVFNDTVIVFADWTDSLNAQNTTARKTFYQYSCDGGFMWEPAPVMVTQLGSAYPDAYPFKFTENSVVVTGRRFVSGISRGYAGVELFLGAGTFFITLVPAPGKDYFSSKLSSNMLGGTFLMGDTLFYVPFNCATSTFGSQKLMALPPYSIDINSRHYITASYIGQNVFVMWWVSTVGNVRMMGRESMNGGVTFGNEFTILPFNTIIHGNAVSAWFGADLIYKPGTDIKCAAMNTLEIGNYATAQGSKIVFWSPNVNGGNPVNIADWTNIPVLMDTLSFNSRLGSIQVGMTPVSHPSLAYSTDGSTLFCVFSVTQDDSSFYEYYFNDLWCAYSLNDGATWSTPFYLTNTSNVDEIYPSISKTGNTKLGNSAAIHVTYMHSNFPGSASFTNTLTPVSKNYHIYKKFQITISGVQNISSGIPESFNLHQNYPNPFNPVTKIKFSLPLTSPAVGGISSGGAHIVQLVVYDVLGREVANLIPPLWSTTPQSRRLVEGGQEGLKPGTYEVQWDGSNYPSGVYFYTLQTNEFTATRKMVLLK
jgi:hypothetical protein